MLGRDGVVKGKFGVFGNELGKEDAGKLVSLGGRQQLWYLAAGTV